jgi:hypothetical protein
MGGIAGPGLVCFCSPYEALGSAVSSGPKNQCPVGTTFFSFRLM